MGSPSSRETAGYDRALTGFLHSLADHDDQWEGGLHREVATRLVGLAGADDGEACLDLGGSAGTVVSALSSAVGPAGWVVTTDISEPAIEVAHSRAPGHTHLMKMTGDDVIFRDHTFDVVVLSRSITHEPDPHAVIAEATRALKLGGRLALFCRRRGLATPAEQAFLDLLAVFVQHHPVNLPHQYLGYPGLADRAEVGGALMAAGLDRISFGDVVTGGRADDAPAWNREMMRCWPAAAILLRGLGAGKRLQFEGQVERAMATLGDEAFRYHHPYLLATGSKVRDAPGAGVSRRDGAGRQDASPATERSASPPWPG
ncbi:MAG TPA: class I SAM-dependent methyltransferase [Candidatus Dormibacteraeota bacterium]|nr:class I SAM-dependent methyltransferase [Candidatus Dormibacteraeota bacterium]